MTDHPEAPLFSDGLGDRAVTADGATGELLQILHLRPTLTAVPSFEFALRERAARLANFRHASYARVRRIDRTITATAPLAVVSDHIEGTRLSELLRVAQERRLTLDINAALYLIRQLVPAVALLHENARDAAHGLIAPERIVVTPQGRLVVVEHVLGAAIEQLQFGRERLWQEFRIAMPAAAGLPRFDHRADVAGIGLVALALVLGRPLARDEYPYHIGALLNEARALTSPGVVEPLSPGLRGWIARALQLELRRAFASASEAAVALEEVLASESLYVAGPVALETFLSRYGASLLEPAPAAVTTPAASAVVPPAAPPVNPPAARAVVAPPAPAVQPPVAPPRPPAPAFAFELEPRVPPAMAVPAPPPPAPVAAAASIADLIEVSDLAPAAPAKAVEASPAATTLFNPDAPFSAPAPVEVPEPARRFPLRRIAALLALVIVAGGGAYAMKVFGGTSASPALGTLVVQSNPAGVPVFVDGVDRGVTPARITIASGAHILELRRGVPRVIPINITAGAEVSQYLEFAEVPALGHLTVQSEPAGAKVIVDGAERGVAPLTVSDLNPGEHEVVLQNEGGTVRHTVVVQAGATAALMVPMTAAAAEGPVSGWVSVKAPFRIEIREQGRLLGTTDVDRLMLTAGRHELELVNEPLGFRTTRVVQVPPGKIASLPLELPKGVVSLNASPWAEVWIDGTRVGETPLGNVSVPIGPHEIVFRHPQLGEKRHAVSVTLGAPVRLSVDMK